MEIAILLVSLNLYGDLILIPELLNWDLTLNNRLKFWLGLTFCDSWTSVVPSNSWEPRWVKRRYRSGRRRRETVRPAGCQTSLSLSAVPHTRSNWVRLMDSGGERHPQNNNKNNKSASVCKWCGTPISGATCACVDFQNPILPGRWQDFPSVTLFHHSHRFSKEQTLVEGGLPTSSSTQHGERE